MLQSRATLDRELENLNTEIVRLSSMADEAIERAMQALYERNVELATDVIKADTLINDLRFQIEEKSLLVLATQQPVAGDLRTIVTTIHVATELERIADHAAGIARLVDRLQDDPEFDTLHKLPKMAKRARKMLAESITAFVERDAELAQNMVGRDDKMDKQYRLLFTETLEEMRDDDYIRRATFLLWVGHDLERIGDRTTNIAERVVFMTTGEFVENIPSAD
ncbi:MAG TPA: phosphate signaling complex protein PhoU [Anaerolineae bacterium]|jgi:phosphate transport system protein|nr:phosphate signaling complex protein PhoU [Anaerolineae bacterium]